ncbi:MAG: Uma2 family endonuclease [Anaerolineae bacterium]|nr:Uma2 family endonuclease [Anaerolineae bacterium]
MSGQLGAMKPDEFLRLAAQPENADRRLELVAGVLVEKLPNNYLSVIGVRIGARLVEHAREHNLGFVTGANGGYRVLDGEYYVPNAAFVSRKAQPAPSHELYNTTPPTLVMEMLAPEDDPAAVRIKVVNYLSAGTVVWLVNPVKQQVEVYTPGHPARKVDINGTLDGGDTLPGFRLALKVIFPEHTDD